jgi:hypothetical protein
MSLVRLPDNNAPREKKGSASRFRQETLSSRAGPQGLRARTLRLFQFSAA